MSLRRPWFLTPAWWLEPRSSPTTRSRSQRRSKPAARMIATRSFTAGYDGDQVEIVAGRTVIDGGHELVARYPDAFKPEASR